MVGQIGREVERRDVALKSGADVGYVMKVNVLLVAEVVVTGEDGNK